jgi:drug/metabolite transporter (DMT)-like permease
MPTYTVSVVLLILSIISISASQLVLKARFQAIMLPDVNVGILEFLRIVIKDPYCWVAAVLIAISVVGWYGALTRLPLRLMLAFSGLFYPFVGFGEQFFLGETLTLQKLTALIVISGGIAWLFLQEF